MKLKCEGIIDKINNLDISQCLETFIFKLKNIKKSV